MIFDITALARMRELVQTREEDVDSAVYGLKAERDVVVISRGVDEVTASSRTHWAFALFLLHFGESFADHPCPITAVEGVVRAQKTHINLFAILPKKG